MVWMAVDWCVEARPEVEPTELESLELQLIWIYLSSDGNKELSRPMSA